MMSQLFVKCAGFAFVLTTAAVVWAQTNPNGPRAGTPEIDAGSAASALTLLVGGAMLLRDRFRAK